MIKARAEKPDVAVDNDVLIKIACYRLLSEYVAARRLGVLGAARFVVATRIERQQLVGDRDGARAAALELVERSVVLEPSETELDFAASIEIGAQHLGLELDAGESQLAAMVIRRGIEMFETGDKRAIRSFEGLIEVIPELEALCGKVRCLEQVILACVTASNSDTIGQAICSEPDVDMTLSICFGCFSPSPKTGRLDRDGIASYIESLRADAPSILVSS